jgi:hypothetical protein
MIVLKSGDGGGLNLVAVTAKLFIPDDDEDG